MAKITAQEADRVLSRVMYPEISFSLVDLGMVGDIVCREDKVELTLKLPFPDVPIKDLLIRDVKQALTGLNQNVSVRINAKQMSRQERDTFVKMAKEGWKL